MSSLLAEPGLTESQMLLQEVDKAWRKYFPPKDRQLHMKDPDGAARVILARLKKYEPRLVRRIEKFTPNSGCRLSLIRAAIQNEKVKRTMAKRASAKLHSVVTSA